MKLIPLTLGLSAMVDDEDYEYLSQWKWHARKGKRTYYAVRMFYKNSKYAGLVRMHHEILPKKEGFITDHKDRNGLNNQKGNLRYCTVAQNNKNRTASKRGSSKYIGVRKGYISPVTGKISWLAQIITGGKNISLGTYSNEEDAAKAYDKAAKEYHGEFAALNFNDKT